MRSLIRPALFMTIRLGLFLSVVAWGVGQWWEVQIFDRQITHGITFCETGVILQSHWIGSEPGGFGAGASYLSPPFMGAEVSNESPGTNDEKIDPDAAVAEIQSIELDESETVTVVSDNLSLVIRSGPPPQQSHDVTVDRLSFLRVDVNEAGLFDDFTVSPADPDLWRAPGVTALHSQIKIDYWLGVFTFATLYTVLKYVYRKRPGSTPCNV
ncbi:hypothetical protein [Fuerstiella marisgermanici]|uniref:Uncharacterized protein n=1 Tax=Fuerstiella marisgermanici TaxID=1891926 RepID=A0A1P8WB48_9PLAN|nr:hypothetical protein [Fuerstiella marisgermanici]APZ91284.1 hypothetical protein Fuma_00870 [Fuerstiella marisgermanici]